MPFVFVFYITLSFFVSGLQHATDGRIKIINSSNEIKRHLMEKFIHHLLNKIACITT